MRDNKTLVEAFAIGLKEYCDCWDYNFIEKLKVNPTEETFVRVFCKVTKTFFFHLNGDTYGAKIDKKEKTASIYKCGKNPEIILHTCQLNDLIEKLVWKG